MGARGVCLDDDCACPNIWSIVASPPPLQQTGVVLACGAGINSTQAYTYTAVLLMPYAVAVPAPLVNMRIHSAVVSSARSLRCCLCNALPLRVRALCAHDSRQLSERCFC